MANKHIDANAFWKKLISKCEEDWCDLMVVYELLNGMPSADVRENVRGEWFEREVTEDVGQGIQEWQQARCSVCGKWHTTPYMYYFTDYDFCPNCGADMRGKEHG